MRGKGPAALMLGWLAWGCSDPDVPEHDVFVSSDCSGASQSARFRFPETDFETSCSGGILSGWCTTNESVGVKQSGDLEVESFVLTGLEETGPQRYELTLPEDDGGHGAWCGWYVNASLEPTEGAVTKCYFGEVLCYAELSVDR
jgi:hypothetical protein